MAAADKKMITLLGLLDLSAAFDTVDHQILFDRLLSEYGLDGLVLGWFKSTMSHEHASTTCINYVSSAVRSPLIQLILLCVHSYTVDLTTVIEFSLQDIRKLKNKLITLLYHPLYTYMSTI